MPLSKPLCYRRCLPAEIISHGVRLYFRFAPSCRAVEKIAASRGVVRAYETVRERALKFGGIYANRWRAKAARPGDRRHLDAACLSRNGKLQYLGRAVGRDGEAPDRPVPPRRNKQAAKTIRGQLPLPG